MGPVHLNLGAEKEKLQEHDVSGIRKKVAVMCWYTANGRSIPHMIKYQDDEGCIQTIKNIDVIKSEKKHYAGVAAHRYDCCATIQGFRFQFVLMYRPDNETWTLVVGE